MITNDDNNNNSNTSNATTNKIEIDMIRTLSKITWKPSMRTTTGYGASGSIVGTCSAPSAVCFEAAVTAAPVTAPTVAAAVVAAVAAPVVAAEVAEADAAVEGGSESAVDEALPGVDEDLPAAAPAAAEAVAAVGGVVLMGETGRVTVTVTTKGLVRLLAALPGAGRPCGVVVLPASGQSYKLIWNLVGSFDPYSWKSNFARSGPGSYVFLRE